MNAGYYIRRRVAACRLAVRGVQDAAAALQDRLLARLLQQHDEPDHLCVVEPRVQPGLRAPAAVRRASRPQAAGAARRRRGRLQLQRRRPAGERDVGAGDVTARRRRRRRSTAPTDVILRLGDARRPRWRWGWGQRVTG